MKQEATPLRSTKWRAHLSHTTWRCIPRSTTWARSFSGVGSSLPNLCLESLQVRVLSHLLFVESRINMLFFCCSECVLAGSKVVNYNIILIWKWVCYLLQTFNDEKALIYFWRCAYLRERKIFLSREIALLIDCRIWWKPVTVRYVYIKN